MQRRALGWAIGLTIVAWGSTAPVEGVDIVPNIKYRVLSIGNTDCDEVPGPDGEGFPYTLNADLQSVGEGCARREVGINSRAFFWSAEHGIEDLDLCDGRPGCTGDSSYARWINDNGTIGAVGFVGTTGLQDQRAFFWPDIGGDCDVTGEDDCDFDDDEAGPCHIIVKEDSAARSVNDHHIVVGWKKPGTHHEAFVYASEEKVMCLLPTDGRPFSIASALDGSTEPLIVGQAGQDAEIGPNEVALWQIRRWVTDGSAGDPCAAEALEVDLLTLGLDGYEDAGAWGVSHAGHVAGLFADDDRTPRRFEAFVFQDQDGDFEEDPDEMFVLTSPGRDCGRSGACTYGGVARAVDSRGWVAGSVVGDDIVQRGAVWRCAWQEGEGTWSCPFADVHDLIDLEAGLEPGERWYVQELWGINELGALVGYGEIHTGEGEEQVILDEPGVALVPLVLEAPDASKVRVQWAVPDATVELYYACSDSHSTDPGGACGLGADGAGAALEIATHAPPFASVAADANGTVELSLAEVDCNGGPLYLQAIDRTSCVVSEVIELVQ